MSVVAAQLGCMVVKELSGQAFSLTVTHLVEALAKLGRKPDDVTKSIHADLVKLIPTSKLKIIQCMLADFEWLRQESKTIDALMERLTELAQTIHYHAQQISQKIQEFNQLYFRGWRTLDVSEHVEAIRKGSHHLEETFDLLKHLLPSCIALHKKQLFPSSNNKSTTPIGATNTQITQIND